MRLMYRTPIRDTVERPVSRNVDLERTHDAWLEIVPSLIWRKNDNTEDIVTEAQESLVVGSRQMDAE